MLKNILFIFCWIGFLHNIFSQQKYAGRKGEFYVNWGYNQASFAKSDIYFKGKGYEFTLFDVVAHDRPSHYHLKEYLNLNKLTIPQYNLRIGYFLNSHWSLSIGSDHMKYVMDNDQFAQISGNISALVSDPEIIVNPKYVGSYNKIPFQINSTDFLVFEHTDGFNYAHFELDNYNKLWLAKNKKIGIDYLFGVGAGLLIPRTDAHLFGIGRNHYWNIAGFGLSGKAGLRFDLSKHFYLQTDLKAGFTDLSDIKTTGRKSDFAQQKIWFFERYIAFGYKFGRHRLKN